jgi:hypothetical protein
METIIEFKKFSVVYTTAILLFFTSFSFADNVSFSWQPNESDDNVLGYRIYEKSPNNTNDILLIEIPSKGDVRGITSILSINYDSITNSGTHSWEKINLSTGFALRALPDIGNISLYNQGPSLTYNINFPGSGQYYVWARGSARGQDDTIHVGIDSVSSIISIPKTDNLEWSNISPTGVKSVISINDRNMYALTVSMREDGFILERILVTSLPDYVPLGVVPESKMLIFATVENIDRTIDRTFFCRAFNEVGESLDSDYVIIPKIIQPQLPPKRPVGFSTVTKNQ